MTAYTRAAGIRSALGTAAIIGILTTTVPAVAATGDVMLRTGGEPGALCTTTGGGSVEIVLQVANLSDAINGVQVRLGYDDALLTLDASATSEAAGWLRVMLTDSIGDVTFAIVSPVGTVGPGPGPFTVATLVFNVDAEGASTVGFRPDSPPYHTRLVVASDNSIIQGIDLGKTDTGTICADDTTATASSNSPICETDTIELYGGPSTGPVEPYTFSWSGPNGFTSSAQDPTIPGATPAMSGSYSLTVTNAAGCAFGPVTTDVAVQADLTVDAGPAQELCEDVTTVNLNGTVTSASSTLWSGGTGTFGDPTSEDTSYTPSASDKEAGSVTLTLTADADAPCAGSEDDDVTITFAPRPEVDAGADVTICGDETVQLGGGASHYAGVQWTTSGDGAFDDDSQMDAVYTPGAADIAGGSVTLSLTATASSPCAGAESAAMTITIRPCIYVNVEIEGLTHGTVNRDVTFVVTTCSTAAESFTESITFTPDLPSGVGVGDSITLQDVRADADWVAVTEGHTLRRLVEVAADFATTKADSIDVTLMPGDFHTATASQDNLVDIVDFAVLATRWETYVDDCDSDPGMPDPNCGMGADVNGDGYQNGDDFAIIQPSFFEIGDGQDACPPAPPATGRSCIGVVALDPKSRVAVRDLRGSVPNAGRADLNGDDAVDVLDIRAFAGRHNLRLSPHFEARLSEMEGEPGLQEEKGRPDSTGRVVTRRLETR